MLNLHPILYLRLKTVEGIGGGIAPVVQRLDKYAIHLINPYIPVTYPVDIVIQPLNNQDSGLSGLSSSPGQALHCFLWQDTLLS